MSSLTCPPPPVTPPRLAVISLRSALCLLGITVSLLAAPADAQSTSKVTVKNNGATPAKVYAVENGVRNYVGTYEAGQTTVADLPIGSEWDYVFDGNPSPGSGSFRIIDQPTQTILLEIAQPKPVKPAGGGEPGMQPQPAGGTCSVTVENTTSHVIKMYQVVNGQDVFAYTFQPNEVQTADLAVGSRWRYDIQTPRLPSGGGFVVGPGPKQTVTVKLEKAGRDTPASNPGIDLAGTWSKGLPSQQTFELAKGTILKLVKRGNGYEMQAGDQGVLYEPVPRETGIYQATSARVISTNGTVGLPQGFGMFRLTVVNNNTLMQQASNNVYFLKRFAGDAPPVVAFNAVGRWSKGRPGIRRFDLEDGIQLDITITPDGLEMSVGDGQRAAYRSIPNVLNNYSGKRIYVKATDQDLTPNGMNQWTLTQISNDEMIQRANGNTYYFHRRPGNFPPLEPTNPAGGMSNPPSPNNPPPFNPPPVDPQPNNPAGGQTGTTGSNFTQQDQQEFMQVHNAERAAVGKAPQTWSPQLAAFAQAYANTLAAQRPTDKRTPPPHNPNAQRQGYGENLAMQWAWGPAVQGPHVMTGRQAAEMWASEKRDYPPGAAIGRYVAQGETLHYTQMIWGTSTQVGAGKASYTGADGQRYTIIIANYSPSGNIIGQTP